MRLFSSGKTKGGWDSSGKPQSGGADSGGKPPTKPKPEKGGADNPRNPPPRKKGGMDSGG